MNRKNIKFIQKFQEENIILFILFSLYYIFKIYLIIYIYILLIVIAILKQKFYYEKN